MAGPKGVSGILELSACQTPAPTDVVAVLCSDRPELLRRPWLATYATVCGFPLSAALVQRVREHFFTQGSLD